MGTVVVLVAIQAISVVAGGDRPSARSVLTTGVAVVTAALLIQLLATRPARSSRPDGSQSTEPTGAAGAGAAPVDRRPGQTAIEADHSAPKPTPNLPPRQILLVECASTDLDGARQALEGAGHRVDVVGNGAEAIMAVLDMTYDIVLMDLQLPYVDGLAATRAIRRLPFPACDIPIVGVGGGNSAGTSDDASAAGMADIIPKPFSSVEVLATLARVLGGAEADDIDDHATLAKLAGLIGEAKVRELLASLARGLRGQFDVPPTSNGRALARRQAHAAIAGAGMLGFTDFSSACRALELAPNDGSFEPHLAALRRQAEAVAAAALDLSRGDAPLASRTRGCGGPPTARLVSS